MAEMAPPKTTEPNPSPSSMAQLTPFILDGRHYDIKDVGELNCKFRKNLGFGHSATVIEVELLGLNEVVALKIFKVLGNWKDEELIKEVNLRTEVSIMGRVNGHRHIVKVLASYTCYQQQQLGFFLQPIANEGTLGELLRTKGNASRGSWQERQRQTLHTCFGCLAGAVAFVHQKQIRHKDISLENVLVHNGKVVLSDFGIAFDATLSEAGITTTEGAVGQRTERYAAPEVVKDGAKRNRKTDIFALGAIYIEIMEALGLIKIAPDVLNKVFRESNRTISHILKEYRYDEGLQCLTGLVQEMISDNKEERPDAKKVVEMLMLSGEADFFCQECFDENTALYS